MTERTAEGGKVAKALKKYLITGMLVWLPIAITIWAVSYIISAADRLISLLPEQWQLQYFWGFNIPGLGIIAVIVVLFLTGVFAANVLGRQILAAWDSLLGRIPVVKSIYFSVKKVSESLLSDSSRSFRTPVLVPFPQPNIWTIAFIYCSGIVLPNRVTPHSAAVSAIACCRVPLAAATKYRLSI